MRTIPTTSLHLTSKLSPKDCLRFLVLSVLPARKHNRGLGEGIMGRTVAVTAASSETAHFLTIFKDNVFNNGYTRT